MENHIKQVYQNNEIEFVRKTDIEGNNNRGWIVNEINAIKNGNELGYIKIAYIPKERYHEWYRCPLDYLIHIDGWACLNIKYKSITEHINRDNLKSISWRLWYNNDLLEKINHMNQVDLNNLFIKINKTIKKTRGKDLQSFYNVHVDKPLVDFIYVKENRRREGIGTQLYLEGSRWVKEMGLRLHASSLQSPQAQAAWEKFKSLGMTAISNNRVILT